MKRPLAAVCLAAILLMAVCAWLHPPAYASYGEASGEEVYLTGHVYKKEYKGSQKPPVLLIYVTPQNLIFQKKAIPFYDNFICILQESEKEPAVGSVVTVRGVLKEYEAAGNPGQFDERSYYAQMGVSACIVRAQILKNDDGKDFLRETLWDIKTFLEKKLDRIFSEKDAAMLKGMLLGDRSAMDAETKTLYKDAGIMHIFAVSGLHITFLGMGLYSVLRKVYVPIIPAAFLGVAIMVLYGMMIGMPVSAMRAIGMFVLRLAAECIGRTYDMLTALAVCAVVMLAGQPLYLYHAGFLLSFSAVCAAAALKPAIQPERKLPPLLESFFMSLAIAVFTLPIQLFFYYEAPVYAVFLNLAVIPLAGAALLLGTAALAVSFLMPPAAAFPAFLVHLIFVSYGEGCRLVNGMSGSLWTVGKPAVWQLIGFYLLTGMILLLRKKLIWRYRMGILCGALLLFAVDGKADLRVTFLDVGQGDSVCLELPDGGAWLYDGGSTSVSGTGTYRIEPFLKSRGITCLDGIFVSHPDEDHVNGVEELLERDCIGVGLLVLPCTEEQGSGFCRLLSLAEERNIPVLWLEAGMEWEDGGVSMACLHPAGGFSGEDANASSLVLYLSYGRFSMLLTGDVEGTGEERFLQRLKEEGMENLSVLKVAHHGSQYATKEAFLETLPPKLAVISAGKNNIYGHPHDELLDRLAACGADIMVTYETGAVTIETDGETMRVKGFLRH